MADIKMTSSWEGGFEGEGRITGEGWSVGIGIPADLGGSGAGASPKELFTAATLACFTATLRAITDKKKVPVEKLSVETSAQATDDIFAIRHIARVILTTWATDADAAAAKAAIETADKVCIVGNLAKKAGVTIDVKAEVSVAA
ncbi:OsmC family protein [Ancylobacter mangrovi]|uniref:OsmC family protein n=1 Tax=Ancylobacter mangrovi TaxID=2972472 RepID=UPI0021611D2A|nr:OsmC family protein [Ancylobacter mangrovi]MCS0505192.1 OsmC family protein [Ancylobacter mangrovi]